MTARVLWICGDLLGSAAIVFVLASPALVPQAGPDLLLAAALPAAFFGSGVVGRVLRPAHVVARRLLHVGLLHLVAVCASTLAWHGRLEAGMPAPASYLLDVGAAVLFALGFVALLDLLARYPDGRYLQPEVGRGITVLAVLGAGLVVLGAAGSPSAPSVLGHPGATNPFHVPALSGTTDLALAVTLAPALGLLLLLVRYPRAQEADRAQMRWPLVTTVVVVVALVTTGALESALGPAGQAAVFVPAAAALPAAFLVGLLRHSEEAERLASVEASRARLADAAAVERRRIERDLHDGAQQQLIGLLARVELTRVRLDAVDPEAARELVEVRDGIRRAHRELRELAQGIYPATLTDHGLAEAVRSAMTRMPGSPTLAVAPQVESQRYDPGVETAVYLFVLECLTNAMKHAGGGPVHVELRARAGELVVTVTDDGPGIPQQAADGAGLTGLRDRLAAVGGRVEVDTGAQGTRLRGLVPAVQRA